MITAHHSFWVLFFIFGLLEPDEPDRPRRRGQRHSLDSKPLLANFHLLKYEKGHELNRKSETVTESCLHTTSQIELLHSMGGTMFWADTELNSLHGEGKVVYISDAWCSKDDSKMSPWGLTLRVKMSPSLPLTLTQIQMWKCAELCTRSIQENTHFNIIHPLHRSFDLILVCSSPCICLKHL